MPELNRLSLLELRDKLKSGQIKAEEACSDCLQGIKSTEPKIQALLNIQEKQALETARQMDAAGPDPEKPLWGVPVIIKDILATTSIPTTCASRILENFTPFYDAHAVAKLKQDGAIILGKSNLDEFAMGSSTENSAFGPTMNPWDLNRVPGGSSGGSAASTAAFQAPFSLGTDTGGSIRQPAAFCGIVGLKPTYGRVSRYGLVAYGSSLDQIGPLARSVGDCAAVLQSIAGHDPKDSTSVKQPVPDYLAALENRQDLNGIRLGVPEEFWAEGLSPEVEKTSRQALDLAQSLGAELVPVSLAHTPYSIAAYYLIVMAEASSNLARFDGVRYGFRAKESKDLLDMYMQSRTQGFGNEVQRRIILGTYALSAGYYDAYYKKAAQVRRLIREDFLQAFHNCDLIASPTCPSTAFKLGEKTDDPLQMYLTDIFTNSLNLTGLPGLCLPVGLGQETQMPVGLQLFAPAFEEERLIEVGHVLQQNIDPLPLPFGLQD